MHRLVAATLLAVFMPVPASAEAVAVRTSPSGGAIVIDGLLAGLDGATVTGTAGERLDLQCFLLGNDGWAPGHAEVVFDGTMTTAVCTMSRATHCVDELQNPFMDCTEEVAATK